MIQPEVELYEVCQTAKGGPLDSLQPGDHWSMIVAMVILNYGMITMLILGRL